MAVTITLTEAQAAGIAELIELAERGREDFCHQAAHGDYSDTDTAAAETRWKSAKAAAEALTAAQAPDVAHPIIAAVENWITYAARMDTTNLWEHFTCTEAEATANIARAAGRNDIAGTILEIHSLTDDPGDDHYRPRADVADLNMNMYSRTCKAVRQQTDTAPQTGRQQT